MAVKSHAPRRTLNFGKDTPGLRLPQLIVHCCLLLFAVAARSQTQFEDRTAWRWCMTRLDITDAYRRSCSSNDTQGGSLMAARMKTKVSPKYKMKYRVKNWAAYDIALRESGGITVCSIS